MSFPVSSGFSVFFFCVMLTASHRGSSESNRRYHPVAVVLLCIIFCILSILTLLFQFLGGSFVIFVERRQWVVLHRNRRFRWVRRANVLGWLASDFTFLSDFWEFKCQIFKRFSEVVLFLSYPYPYPLSPTPLPPHPSPLLITPSPPQRNELESSSSPSVYGGDEEWFGQRLALQSNSSLRTPQQPTVKIWRNAHLWYWKIFYRWVAIITTTTAPL